MFENKTAKLLCFRLLATTLYLSGSTAMTAFTPITYERLGVAFPFTLRAFYMAFTFTNWTCHKILSLINSLHLVEWITIGNSTSL
jgi:hypothetical protein